MEVAIPDWKKGAVVVTDHQAAEEGSGLLGKLKKKVTKKLTSTEAARAFMESEEYKRIEQLRKEV